MILRRTKDRRQRTEDGGTKGKGPRESLPLSSVFCPLSSHTGAGRPLSKWLLGVLLLGLGGLLGAVAGLDS